MYNEIQKTNIPEVAELWKVTVVTVIAENMYDNIYMAFHWEHMKIHQLIIPHMSVMDYISIIGDVLFNLSMWIFIIVYISL